MSSDNEHFDYSDDELINDHFDYSDDEHTEPEEPKKEPKPRIIRPLDNQLLLSDPNGLKLLRKKSKALAGSLEPIAGKEYECMSAIFNAYQQWSHEFYPRLMADQLMTRVERMCSSKTMQAYMARVYQAECNNEEFDEELVYGNKKEEPIVVPEVAVSFTESELKVIDENRFKARQRLEEMMLKGE